MRKEEIWLLIFYQETECRQAKCKGKKVFDFCVSNAVVSKPECFKRLCLHFHLKNFTLCTESLKCTQDFFSWKKKLKFYFPLLSHFMIPKSVCLSLRFLRIFLRYNFKDLHNVGLEKYQSSSIRIHHCKANSMSSYFIILNQMHW